MTTIERNISKAFQSASDLHWLHAYLRGLLDAGADPGVLEAVLKRVALQERDGGDQELADLMLDGLDFLHGWVAPGLELPARRSA